MGRRPFRLTATHAIFPWFAVNEIHLLHVIVDRRYDRRCLFLVMLPATLRRRQEINRWTPYDAVQIRPI
jgi:hypothetical protein